MQEWQCSKRGLRFATRNWVCFFKTLLTATKTRRHEGNLTTNKPGAAFGRNQIKKLKVKRQKFGIPINRDKSLLFQ